MLYLSPRNEELLARPPLPCENDMVVKSSATLHRTVLQPVHIRGQRNSSSGIQPGPDNKRILASRYFATFPGQIFRHLPRRNVTILYLATHSTNFIQIACSHSLDSLYTSPLIYSYITVFQAHGNLGLINQNNLSISKRNKHKDNETGW